MATLTHEDIQKQVDAFDIERIRFLAAILFVADKEFQRIADDLKLNGLSAVHLGIICAAIAELGEEASRYVVETQLPERAREYEQDLRDIRVFTKHHSRGTSTNVRRKTSD